MKKIHASPRRVARLAFTLIEMIVSLGIFVLVVTVLSMIISQASRAWRAANQQMQVAQSARVTFDLLNRDLQGIFVNNQYSSSFGQTSLSFFASVPNPSGAWDICRVRYNVSGNSLVRFFEYVTAPGSSLTTSITSEIAPNVWTITGQSGFTLTYLTANGSFIFVPPTAGTTTLPSRIGVEIKLTDLESIKGGGSAMVTPVATYSTTIFIPQGFR